MSKKTTRRTASNRLSDLSLTIYPGYALVQGSYPVRLNEGVNRFQVEGLPTNYDPSSLYFDSFTGPGEITLGASSYRAANLSPTAMIQRSVNKRVTVRYGGTTEAEQHEVKGTLVAFAGNTALLRIPGQGVREIRNVVGYTFSEVPEGLSNTPSLSVAVEATKDGDYVASLLYKALGFNWSADYKWMYDEKSGKISWDGSVFISNSSGAGFPNAQLKVVAGDAGAEPESFADAQPMAMAASFGGGGLESASRSSRKVRQATNESLGQVKVFTIPVKGDVEEGESQKIPFFTASEVPVTRENRVAAYHGWHHARNARIESPVQTILIFTNDAENKLGVPLPGGSVSVMQRDASGGLLKTGGAYMQDVAVGEERKLTTGTDFDLKATRIVTDIQRAEELEKLPVVEGESEADAKKRKARKKVTTTKTCAVELFNGKPYPVEFVLEETTAGDELRFDGKHGFTQTAAGQHEQKCTVPAGEKATVTYTLVQTHFENQN